jgi:hypothetical protein
MEEQGSAGGAERQVAKLVEDDEIGVGEPGGDLSWFALKLLLFKSIDEFNGGEEADALAMVLDGLDADRGGEMRLACAGTADQDDIVSVFQELAARCCHGNLALAERTSEWLGLSSGRRRCLPILERFASEGAERVAGNKMALNVESYGRRREWIGPLRRSGRFETLHLPLASSHWQMRIFGPVVLAQALLMSSR